MKPQKPFHRFLLGAAIALVVIVTGFAWISALIPTWGSTPDEISRSLPADELVPDPSLIWNHAITIRAPVSEVYPWLVQIGDSRAAFYSFQFIENAFCATSGACRYVNAERVHPEWQNPVKGEQGIIINYMVIQDYKPDQFVLAVASAELPLSWSWLWYLQPQDANTTRLIVRHRIAFPADAPQGMIDAIFATGYVMERGMLLGVKARAEGNVPGPLEEPLGAIIWLLVFGMGVACAVRFVRVPDGYHGLGVGLEAIIVLFILTYLQPPMVWRVVLLLMVAAGVVIAFDRKLLLRIFNRVQMPA